MTAPALSIWSACRYMLARFIWAFLSAGFLAARASACFTASPVWPDSDRAAISSWFQLSFGSVAPAMACWITGTASW
ncbi:hypothetical protein D9M72_632350 [compost metagenome]